MVRGTVPTNARPKVTIRLEFRGDTKANANAMYPLSPGVLQQWAWPRRFPGVRAALPLLPPEGRRPPVGGGGPDGRAMAAQSRTGTITVALGAALHLDPTKDTYVKVGGETLTLKGTDSHWARTRAAPRGVTAHTFGETFDFDFRTSLFRHEHLKFFLMDEEDQDDDDPQGMPRAPLCIVRHRRGCL